MTKSVKAIYGYWLLCVVMFAFAFAAQAPPEQRSLPKEGAIAKLDAALDGLIPQGAKVEKVADGLKFGEGAVWVRKPAWPFPPMKSISTWTIPGSERFFVSR